MAQGTCPSNVPAGVTKCYFIDYAGGSDANNGTTDSAPWQHAPGFANATGTPLAHTPSAGEGWIFKGGVTVDYHAWPANVPWGGTASNPTYIGVDPTWHTGTSWVRPIFSGGGSTGYDSNSRAMLTDVTHNTNYFIIDSIEFTGLYWSGNCGPSTQYACAYLATHSFNGVTNWEAKNLHVHGWSHPTGSFSDPGNYQYLIGVGMQAAAGTQSSIHDSIFDGSDTTKDCCAASDAAITYNNYYAYLNNMYFQQAPSNQVSVFHDNYIVHQTGTLGNNGVHSNCFHSFAAGLTTSGGTFLVYDNYIDCKDAGTQAEGLLFETNGVTAYIFNNIVTLGQPSGITPSAAKSGQAANVYYVFNNTVDTYDATSTPGSQCYNLGYNSVGTFLDNFCITNNNNSTSYGNYTFTGSVSFPSPTFSIDCHTGRGAQSNFGATQICAPIGSGNGTGNLNISETYPFAPMDATAAAKVGTGQNKSALCAAVSAINAAAGRACLSDTTLGVAYDASNHTVSWPNRPPVPRPTGTTAWTNGAYEYGSGTSSVAPPSGLTATVN